MHPWERRLKDLAHTLRNCEETYFDPDLFRMNTNHFLQTSRTVTFIIQKNKASIPSFDDWYQLHVLNPWASDKVMSWARDSRNKIEKEGDIDLKSELSATLIFSYLEERDISIPCGYAELVRANVKRLIRYARRELPSGLSDVSVVRIDRRWVANSLSNWELMTALVYIYARIYDVCMSLAKQLGSQIDNIHSAEQFDPNITESRKAMYVSINGREIGRQKSQRIARDAGYVPPPNLVKLMEGNKDAPPIKSLKENIRFYADFAKLTFEQFDNHIPMLLMFDGQWQVVDLVSTYFKDQAAKYVFWRMMAERVQYLKPHSIIWICEAWIRELGDFPKTLMRNSPIKGENLQVIGLDQGGNMEVVVWDICRDSPDAKPRLELSKEQSPYKEENPSFLTPIRKAFEKLID